MKPKKVVMVTPEFYPHTMIGGLAMGVSGLSNALQSQDIDIHVIMPSYYDYEDSKKFNPNGPYYLSSRYCNNFNISNSEIKGINLHHIDCANLGIPFAKPETYSLNYSPDVSNLALRRHTEELFRTGLVFSSTIPKALKESKLLDADIVHLHEWVSAGAAYWIRKNPELSSKPILLTIHNANYIGKFPVSKERPRESLIFPWGGKESVYNKMTEGNSLVADNKQFLSLLEFGLEYCDLANTVSQTEAREVLNGRQGVDPRIVEVLNKKGLEGVLNGLDHNVMDPKNDKIIGQYDPLDFKDLTSTKILNKDLLEKTIDILAAEVLGRLYRKISINPDGFLVTMMARLTSQKCIDQVLQAAKEINEIQGLQLLVIGEPDDPNFNNKIIPLKEYKNVYIYPSFSGTRLKHLALGASDAILAVSREEPCGYTPMEGMRYGCAPIATMVGGHKEYIELFNGEKGFGFEVTPYPQDIVKSLRTANQVFKDKEKWSKVTRNAASKDMSWQGPNDSLGKYLGLYSRLMESKA